MDMQFSFDDNITFAFDTGGAVPPPAADPTPVTAFVLAVSAGAPVFGDLEILEV